MTMIAGLLRITRRSMERHASLSERELRTMLLGLNQANLDMGHRFCYDEYLGGLAHVQWSYLQGDNFFLLSPRCLAFPSQRPIDRVCLNPNGVMCTLAPEGVTAMYQRSLANNTVRVSVRDAQAGWGPPPICANCLRHSSNLMKCACGMVRYCGPRCQRAHWRTGHKTLCRWCRSCMETFGPMEMDDLESVVLP